MSAHAIYNTTRALSARLQVALTASAVPGSVFVGPLDDPDAGGAALILFLYRVMPNASLRNRERRVLADTIPPAPVTYLNSLPLDLHFLITVGKSPGNSEELLLRALGFVMRELQAEPDLTGPIVNHEVVHVSYEALSTDEISRVWNLFPAANYRTSIAYVASPVWIDPQSPSAPAERVAEDRLLSAPGRVEDPA